jgi:hypothetical protein
MKYHILIFILLLGSRLAFPQEWEVPPDRDKRLSPFEFSELTVSSGESIYNLNCKLCHGDPGKGNFQPLDPAPGDPATEKVQINSDGSLQFKISEGRGLMPSFKRVLNPDDVWNVISYIRSFNPNYTQSVAVARKLTNLKWSDIKIFLEHNKEEHSLVAQLVGLEKDEWTPVPDTEVRLLAKRYFGDMPVDMPRISDSKGEVVFDVSDELAGDSTGGIEVIVQLTDFELFGDLRKDTILQIGHATLAPPLNKDRAMWNVNRKAPIWLIIAYPGVVLAVWSLIFFVLFRLRAIYREGEDVE